MTDQLLATTRAVRRRLDTSRRVEREVVLECIRLSQQAPTGSNRQGWRWLVVEDAATRAALARLYAEGANAYLVQMREQLSSASPQTRRVYESATWLMQNLAEVPLHVIPCIEGRLPEGASNFVAASLYGSIFPAVWSFQLALRSRGLGSTLTTLHLYREREAAQLLDIPDGVSQVALLPVAYTRGADFKPASRPPPGDITFWNTWGRRS
ncbi:MAG TPA: nitroreductase family protein [Myxococcota bacterium]